MINKKISSDIEEVFDDINLAFKIFREDPRMAFVYSENMFDLYLQLQKYEDIPFTES